MSKRLSGATILWVTRIVQWVSKRVSRVTGHVLRDFSLEPNPI